MLPRSASQSGVVAVITQADRFLVIRRSALVRAPGAICFPGGHVEPGESEQQAVVRELEEELAITAARPLRRLWTSQTPRGVHLAWWETTIDPHFVPVPNPAEVAECFWWTLDEMDRADALLATNRQFLAWWRSR